MFKKYTITLFVFYLTWTFAPGLVLAQAQTYDPNFCAPADEGGYYNPVYSMSYDYGPDGLVRFYYNLSSDWGLVYASVLFYDSACVNHGGTTHNRIDIAGTNLLVVRAVPQPENSNAYYFQVEDGNTGSPFGQIWPTFTGSFTADSIIAISFGSGYYGGAWVQSSGVHLKSIKPPKTPILIVPGVLGTDLYKGNDLLWANPKMVSGFDGFMDPLAFNPDLTPVDNSITVGGVIKQRTILGLGTHYLDGLITNLVNQGYTEGVDLFTFPYDWRFGVNDDNVSSLKGQIDYILNLTHAGKVDVVAHSTGGLLVKKYAMEHPADHHLGKAVFVGVPNLGAPLALKVLTVGDAMGVPGFDAKEFKKIGHNMPVVYDLSPSPGYYSNLGSFLHISTPAALSFNDQERDMNYLGATNNLIENGLLNNLGVQENKNLHSAELDNFDVRTAGVDAYNVVGCKTATLGKFTEVVSANASINFSFPKVTAGDGTVPFGSADSIVTSADKTFFVPKIEHTNLLSGDGPSQQIVNILAGASLDTHNKILSYASVAANPELCSLKGEYLNIFSPVEISAVDGNGNEVPYENWNGQKFIFLPTDDNQHYSIKLKGVGVGPAIIKEQTLTGDVVTKTQVFSSLAVTPGFNGQINLSNNNSTSTIITEPGVIYPSAVVGESDSQDAHAPAAFSTVAGIKGYTTVSLYGSDSDSGLLEIDYSLDGKPYQKYKDPLTINTGGAHQINFYAVDYAGNMSLVNNVSFTVISSIKPPLKQCCGPCC